MRVFIFAFLVYSKLASNGYGAVPSTYWAAHNLSESYLNKILFKRFGR